MNGWRPLDWFGSIRTKLSVLVAGSVVIAVALGAVDPAGGWPLWIRMGASVAIGLAVMRLVSSGLTSPLREMAKAAKAMAGGDYSRRIRATSRDEVGRLAEAFNDMSTKLAEVDRQRRDLIANASHELRTPIAALQAMIENLVDGVSEADPEFVGTMHDQVRRLATLVDQLLSLSRLDSGETPLHIEPASVASLVERSVEEFRWHHPEVEVEVEVSPETLMVEVDQMLMHRVLMNLLENASRYGAPPFSVTARESSASATGPGAGIGAGAATTTGTHKAVVALHAPGLHGPHGVRGDRGDRGDRGGGGTVVIEVADHGPGIAPADASLVFERFQRLDQSRRSGGSGLGLAIVNGIVERHHGHISVEPNRPTGCRMVISLPQKHPIA